MQMTILWSVKYHVSQQMPYWLQKLKLLQC